jgi:hypothetical protein
MSRGVCHAAKFVLFATSLLAPILRAESDPFFGTWKMDVLHSKYPDGNCPKSMVIEMKEAERGIRLRGNRG